jgi:hypothetical protein
VEAQPKEIAVKFILLVLFVVGGEGQTSAVAFPTKEACEIAGEKTEEIVVNINAEMEKQGERKADAFAFACVPLLPAPQGKQS